MDSNTAKRSKMSFATEADKISFYKNELKNANLKLLAIKNKQQEAVLLRVTGLVKQVMKHHGRTEMNRKLVTKICEGEIFYTNYEKVTYADRKKIKYVERMALRTSIGYNGVKTVYTLDIDLDTGTYNKDVTASTGYTYHDGDGCNDENLEMTKKQFDQIDQLVKEYTGIETEFARFEL